MPVDFCRAGGGCCTQGTLPQLLCDLPLPTAGRTQRDSLARGAGDTGVPEACPDLHTALLNSRVTKPSAGRKPRASTLSSCTNRGFIRLQRLLGLSCFPCKCVQGCSDGSQCMGTSEHRTPLQQPEFNKKTTAS